MRWSISAGKWCSCTRPCGSSRAARRPVLPTRRSDPLAPGAAGLAYASIMMLPARRGRKRRPRLSEPPTPRKGEMLDVAAGLFAERGFEAVSLADIAEGVGLAKATLYHYFSHKEEILGTIVVTTIRELTAFIDRAIAQVTTPE